MSKVTFGEFVRTRRGEAQITLRDFCRVAELDPSNWSKVERGLLAPPDDEEQLGSIAKALDIKKGSAAWHEVHDLAFAERGKIPTDLMADEELVAKLPVFFRTIRGEKPEEDELRGFAEKLRKS